MPARKYPMTVDEIVTSYRQARNRQAQIGVLADLNVCTRKEIKDLLAEAGALEAPLENKGGRPMTFDTELARRLWSEGLTDTEIAAQLGIPVVRFAKWRQRVGLLRPRTAQTRREDTTKKPAQAGGVQEEQSMKKQNVDAQETCRTAAPGAVTVKGLRVLLDAAEAAGYGDVPLEVKGCRFAEMHLRVETLIGAEAPGTLVELMATPAEA
jgi:hypothetical protein|nr:MAG TPA: gamma delta resolvase [Caudoviricetes sp.]